MSGAQSLVRFITLAEVEQMTSLGRSTIDRRVKAGDFPKPRNLGGRCVRWLAGEVEEWMLQRPLARTHAVVRGRSAA